MQCLQTLSLTSIQQACEHEQIDLWEAHHAAMATKSRAMASKIGSTPWLDQENQQMAQFAAQETDDFVFSVRNELDFLNEHMADIFSKNQVYDFYNENGARADFE